MPLPSIPPSARAAILAWYGANGRALAFRATKDPYAILVSEAMAQQTQAERAATRWRTFIDRFPTVASLAAATPADVLREWRGLGYNRRGLNLWRAAQAIVERHGGAVPSSVDELERLPGVGPYTARAVAAFAFGQPVGPVDTNVRRVLGRLAGGMDGLPARSVQAAADANVPAARAAEWSHALMDLGATVCIARIPACDRCPARPWCRAAGEGLRPLSTKRAARRSAPFRATSRWLRGRLVDRLRDAPPGEWLTIQGGMGTHDAPAVECALAALAAEGLVERHPSVRWLWRLALR